MRCDARAWRSGQLDRGLIEEDVPGVHCCVWETGNNERNVSGRNSDDGCWAIPVDARKIVANDSSRLEDAPRVGGIEV